jgi:hypothetical protein
MVRSAAAAAGDDEAVKTEETFWKTPLPSNKPWEEERIPGQASGEYKDQYDD